jgi:hypothetical protein
MDKKEIRNLVLEEENTAQIVLENKLLKENKRITELSFLEPLHGNLNLGVLSKYGYTHIKSIYFAEGEITGITNLPEGLKKIILSKNLITTIELPDSVEYADLTHNDINKLDVSNLVNLERLFVSFNNLKKLELRSDKLKELHCDHNRIKELDLLSSTSLEILRARYNPIMKIYNSPDSLLIIETPPESSFYSKHANGEIDGGISASGGEAAIGGAGGEDKFSYRDSIMEYFRIKSEYEKKHMKFMQQKKKQLPPCVGCGGNKGMHFSNANGKYEAFCANSPPCKWKIVIHRPSLELKVHLLEELDKMMQTIKEKIICLKMDTIFQHITEEKSAELFEKELEIYQKVSKQYGELLSNYTEDYFSDSKKELIRKKKFDIQQNLQKVTEAIENGDFRLAADIQINRISPIGKEIQRLCYEKSYIYSGYGEKLDMPSVRLVQEEISNEKLETVSVKTFDNKNHEINWKMSGWVEHFGKK